MIVRTDKTKLEEDELMQQLHGSLTNDIRLETIAQKLYYLIYCIRRLVYVLLAYSIYNMPPVFQIIGIITSSTYTIIYYGLASPLVSRFDRRMELANEFLVNACALALLPLTEWNADPVSKYAFSWVLIG